MDRTEQLKMWRKQENEWVSKWAPQLAHASSPKGGLRLALEQVKRKPVKVQEMLARKLVRATKKLNNDVNWSK